MKYFREKHYFPPTHNSSFFNDRDFTRPGITYFLLNLAQLTDCKGVFVCTISRINMDLVNFSRQVIQMFRWLNIDLNYVLWFNRHVLVLGAPALEIFATFVTDCQEAYDVVEESGSPDVEECFKNALRRKFRVVRDRIEDMMMGYM